jgi:exopolysaccharide biosynthesis polyprenyl glycosylphosphotransferase
MERTGSKGIGTSITWRRPRGFAVIAPAGPALKAPPKPQAPSKNGDAKVKGGPVDRFATAYSGGIAAAARLGVLPPRAARATQRMLDACRYLDVAAVLGAVVGVFVLTNSNHPGAASIAGFLNMRVTVKNLLLLAGFAAVLHASLTMFGMYDERRLEEPMLYAMRLVAACLVGGIPLVLFPMASSTGAVRPISVGYFVTVAVVTLAALRWLVWLAAAPSPAAAIRNVLIVGSGPRAQRLYHELYAHAEDAVQIYGFVDTNPDPIAEEIAERMIGTLDDLEGILMRHVIDDVLITLPIKSCYGKIQNTIALCERLGVRAAYLADVFQSSLGRPSYEQTGRFPVVRMHVVTDDHRMLVKRAMDLIGGSVGLIVAAPVMLVVAIAIKMSGPGPVIFSQQRFGLNKRRFAMYKFRTMVIGAEALQADLETRNEATGPVFKIRDDPRVTRVGRLLRRMSLDELPQLFNVVRGDMSLVGPRPLPVRDVHKFSESWLMRRFSVPPGVTGLWQISGRSDLAFDRWVLLDLQYIDGWSLGLDLQILAKTVPAVLWGRGAA